jgi:hypothetical protein
MAWGPSGLQKNSARCHGDRSPRTPGGSPAAPWSPPHPGVRRDLWDCRNLTSRLPRHRQCPQARRCPVRPGGIPSIEPPWLRFTALREVPRLTSLTPTRLAARPEICNEAAASIP